jgi:hypothetical protein
MKIDRVVNGFNLNGDYIFRCSTSNFLEILSLYEWCKDNIPYRWVKDDLVWKSDDSDDFIIEIQILNQLDAILFKMTW